MNILADDTWQKLVPLLKQRCPRLTPADLGEAQQRIDLLTAKIQNRHWISRTEARRVVLGLLKDMGALTIGA